MPRSSLLAGKVALVTGASRNIGAATAKAFAGHGAAVVVNYASNDESARQVVRDIETQGGRALAHRADVTDPEQVRQMMNQAVGTFGRLDILVNNARPIPTKFKKYLEITWDELEARVVAELKALDFCCRSVFPHMMEQGGGKIINVSSVAARHPGASAEYAVAKAAMEGLSKAIAHEFGPHNISVNIVAPGRVLTERTRASHYSPEELERMTISTPLRRFASCDDIAGAILLLALDEAAYVTGQYLYLNGGATMP